MLRQILPWMLCILAVSGVPSVYAGQGGIKFGSVAMDVPTAMHKRLKPLTRYLSESLGRPVNLKLSKNMQEAIGDVSSHNVDLTYLTPVAYIRAHDMGQAKLVVKTITKGKAAFKLMIVVREDSPIKTVDDLNGKTFAFGDPAALLQRATVVGANMPLENFSSYKFLGHYDNIARAVMRREFDAGILKDTMAYKWQGKGLRILYSSPELPPYNITAGSKLDEATLDKIKQAFLDLDINNPEHLKVIKALDKKYDGFAPTTDEEYDVVRQLIKPFK
ncbi:ABC transporter, substrate-binding protein (cluster 12, methionine/phosphonates) [hydrothermal vent metagenome]|uniref:ABC transporter, substrate-binding protein (Cluster 12, methionine/phosphonates) n=1 Tax=hydrothermal vent metagenome TaxID=652676 RepID=A0A3B0YUB1_9ZZZZ